MKYAFLGPESTGKTTTAIEIVRRRHGVLVPEVARDYLVEKGLKPPSVLQKDLYTGFFNKMANSINDNMYAFQNARNKFQGKFFPITLPP